MPKVFGTLALASCFIALTLSAIALGVPRWSSNDTFTEGIGSICLRNTQHHGRVCLQYYTVNHFDFMGSISSGLCRIDSDSSVWAAAAMKMNLTTTQVVDHINVVCSARGNAVVGMIAVAMLCGFISLVVLFNGVCLRRMKTYSLPVVAVCVALAFVSSVIAVAIYAVPPEATYAVSWYLYLIASVVYVVAFTCTILYRSNGVDTQHNDCLDGQGHVLIDTPLSRTEAV